MQMYRIGSILLSSADVSPKEETLIQSKEGKIVIGETSLTEIIRNLEGHYTIIGELKGPVYISSSAAKLYNTPTGPVIKVSKESPVLIKSTNSEDNRQPVEVDPQFFEPIEREILKVCTGIYKISYQREYVPSK